MRAEKRQAVVRAVRKMTRTGQMILTIPATILVTTAEYDDDTDVEEKGVQ